jgi:hypothetical protein
VASRSRDSLPKAVHEAIEGMALRFNADVAGDLQATIQFNVSPSTLLKTGGEYYLSIAGGKCDFSTGTAPEPTLTISTAWLIRTPC